MFPLIVTGASTASVRIFHNAIVMPLQVVVITVAKTSSMEELSTTEYRMNPGIGRRPAELEESDGIKTPNGRCQGARDDHAVRAHGAQNRPGIRKISRSAHSRPLQVA